MTLAPDNIRPGQFVSILETVLKRTREGQEGPVRESKQYAGAGAVLEVIAVSHPFVLVRSRTPSLLGAPGPFPVDLRRTRLIALSDEYVAAATEQMAGERPDRSVFTGGPTPTAQIPFSWGAMLMTSPDRPGADGEMRTMDPE